MRRSRTIAFAGAISLALTLGVVPALADTEPAPPAETAVAVDGGEQATLEEAAPSDEAVTVPEEAAADAPAAPEATVPENGGVPAPEAVTPDLSEGSAPAAAPAVANPTWRFTWTDIGGWTMLDSSDLNWDYYYDYRYVPRTFDRWWIGELTLDSAVATGLVYRDNGFDDIAVPMIAEDNTGSYIAVQTSRFPWFLPFGGASTARVDGATRYEVSANVAMQYFHRVDTVYLANGLAYADALAAAAVAGHNPAGSQSPEPAGPVLLTNKTAIPTAVLDQISALDPARVVLLGGTGSIANSVQTQLRGMGYTVERWSGLDRYQVAASIANNEYPEAVGIVIANGFAPADALAAAPYAAREGRPILLTNTGALPWEAQQYIENHPTIQYAMVMGGEGSVGPDVVGELESMGLTVTRVYGQDRYDVAATFAMDYDSGPSRIAYVANGLAYADALAAGPVAGLYDGPVLLVTQNGIPLMTQYALRHIAPEQIVVLGGPGSVSQSVLNQLESYTAP